MRMRNPYIPRTNELGRFGNQHLLLQRRNPRSKTLVNAGDLRAREGLIGSSTYGPAAGVEKIRFRVP